MAQAGNSRRAHRSATASGLPDAVPATTGGDSDGDLPVPRWKASAHARVCDDAGLVRISRSRHDASIASPLMQPSPIGRRVGIRIVTFEACSGFTHVTARRIAQPPGRPLSRGSGPAGYPAEPLVSYRINRQLSGWNLPPLMIRLRGARPTSDINHAVAMARGDSDLGVC
jgi:hypothetical protein